MEVHFPPDLEKKLGDLAAQRGQGTDELVQNLVARCIDELAKPEVMGEQRQPLRRAADIILSRMRNVPPEIMAALPKDGASQHNHYIYRGPKKES